jgi:hypothetical protein
MISPKGDDESVNNEVEFDKGILANREPERELT